MLSELNRENDVLQYYSQRWRNMNFNRDNPIVEYLETLIEEENNDEKSFPSETDTEKNDENSRGSNRENSIGNLESYEEISEEEKEGIRSKTESDEHLTEDAMSETSSDDSQCNISFDWKENNVRENSFEM